MLRFTLTTCATLWFGKNNSAFYCLHVSEPANIRKNIFCFKPVSYVHYRMAQMVRIQQAVTGVNDRVLETNHFTSNRLGIGMVNKGGGNARRADSVPKRSS